MLKNSLSVAVVLLANCLHVAALTAQEPQHSVSSAKPDVASAAPRTPEKGTITVVVPSTGEKAYQIASEAFVELWGKVTQRRPALIPAAASPADPPTGDVVLIGSDAVQPIVHDLIRRGVLETLDLAGTRTHQARSIAAFRISQ